MTGTNNIGQAVGGASAIALGSAVLGSEVAMLPSTGVGSFMYSVLPYLAIALGVMVITSLIVSRVVRKAR